MSLPVVMLVIALFWIAFFAFYVFTSRRQNDLSRDLEQVQRRLDQMEREG